MKSLFKIICRYSFTAGMIIFAILLSNVAVFLYWGYRTIQSDQSKNFDRASVEEIGRQFYPA